MSPTPPPGIWVQQKPSPDIYVKAIANLGLTPDECLIVENNHFGWQAATQSGAHLLKVRDVHDVNYCNIRRAIEAAVPAARAA